DGDVLVLEAAARSGARDADLRRDEALRRRLDGLVRDDGRVALEPELGVLAGVAVRDLLDDVDAPAVVAAHGQLELPVRAIVVRDGGPVAVRGDRRPESPVLARLDLAAAERGRVELRSVGRG